MAEEYFFETLEKPEKEKKVYILVIYDIIDNRRRLKFATFIEGFGIRVQKSCFEAIIPETTYRKIIREIPKYIDEEEDSVRCYRIIGETAVTLFGINCLPEAEDIIII